MAASDLKLLGAWPSPYVIRVRIALHLKGIDYEFLEENFGAKSELLLKSNPVHKKIPVLIHNNKPICESLIILQYIDEVWTQGPSILPSDPYDRAVARFWASYIDDKWYPLLREVGKAEGEEAKAAAMEKVAEATLQLEEGFLRCSKGKAFFGGETVGYLDIAIGCFLGWLKVGEEMHGVKFLDATKTPALVEWAERFCTADAIKDVLPSTEKLMELAMILKNRAQASPN